MSVEISRFNKGDQNDPTYSAIKNKPLSNIKSNIFPYSLGNVNLLTMFER